MLARRPGLNHRPPEQQRRGQESRYARAMPGLVPKRIIIGCRSMPEQKSQIHRQPGDHRLCQKAPGRQERLELKSGPRTVRIKARGSPRSSGTTGNPSNTSGGTADISSRCCTMWALSNASAKPSSGEARASQRVPSPSRKTVKPPSRKKCRARAANREPAAHIDRSQFDDTRREQPGWRPLRKDEVAGGGHRVSLRRSWNSASTLFC